MKKLQLWRAQAARTLLALWKDEKQRVNLLVGIGVAGMLLLAVSAWVPAEQAPEPADAAGTQNVAGYAENLESRLEEMITRMEGAGKTRVMVTLQTGEESVYATDRDVSGDGTVSTSHVLVGGGALLETVATPRILGVAVICEGGGDAAVQNRVSVLVETLTGVGANHITVAGMAPTN